MPAPAANTSTQNAVPEAMSRAVARLIDVCSKQFAVALEPDGPPVAFDASQMAYGARISLVKGDGSLDIGLFGTKTSAQSMARFVLALEEDETPPGDEVADLFGEIVNMVSGLVKRELTSGAADVQISVPLILLDDDCGKFYTKSIPVFAQILRSEDIEGSVVFVWAERSPTALLGEIAAWLAAASGSDKFALAQVLALLEEFSETLSEAAEIHRPFVEDCQQVLLTLINGAFSEPELPVAVLREAIVSLQPAFLPGGHHVELALPSTTIAQRQGSQEPAARKHIHVERDQETLDTLAEFLSEAEEGLERCDQILLRVEQGGIEDDDVNALFRSYHSIKGVSSFLELDAITRVAHATENLLGTVREGKLTLAGVVLDLVFESTEFLRAELESIREAVERSEAFYECPGVDSIRDRLSRAQRGERVDTRRGEAPSQAANHAPAPGAAASKPALKATLRVEEELVERLESAVNRLQKLVDPSEATLKAVTNELREVTLLMRMISVGATFQKMARMVRDLSKKTGKLTRLVLVGEDTKVSRHVLDKVGEPLVHMIRNAVDHGIEAPELRATTAKPPMGTIKLGALHENGRVIIFIEDDGKGLDRERLVAKALSMGIISDDTILTESESYALIFAAGFSTAAAVTDISGRGVGMDVVRRNIEALGGTIHIESTLGRGTKFRLSFPLIDDASS